MARQDLGSVARRKRLITCFASELSQSATQWCGEKLEALMLRTQQAEVRVTSAGHAVVRPVTKDKTGSPFRLYSRSKPRMFQCRIRFSIRIVFVTIFVLKSRLDSASDIRTNFTTVESHASWDQVPKDIESFNQSQGQGPMVNSESLGRAHGRLNPSTRLYYTRMVNKGSPQGEDQEANHKEWPSYYTK
jgi:hypothetical protein